MPKRLPIPKLNTKVNDWLILEPVLSKHKTHTYYRCQCKCGKKVTLSKHDLFCSDRKSCRECKINDRLDKEMPGKKFGFLEVKKRGERKRGNVFWECLCSLCGKMKDYTIPNLNSGFVVSCGCLRKVKGKKNKSFKGFEEISGILVCSIRKNAKIRGLVFKLSAKYLWELFLKQNRKCALSGIKIFFPPISKISPKTASLDRIDSNKGYIEGNVQWVHKDLNKMKQNFHDKKFIKLCQLVCKFYMTKINEQKLFGPR